MTLGPHRVKPPSGLDRYYEGRREAAASQDKTTVVYVRYAANPGLPYCQESSLTATFHPSRTDPTKRPIWKRWCGKLRRSEAHQTIPDVRKTSFAQIKAGVRQEPGRAMTPSVAEFKIETAQSRSLGGHDSRRARTGRNGALDRM